MPENLRKLALHGRYRLLKCARRLCARAGLRRHLNSLESSRVMPTRECPFDDVTRLIQVFGTPRSGTTLLASVLNSHAGILCLSEPFLAFLTGRHFSYNDKGIEKFSLRSPSTFINDFCRREKRAVAFKETFRIAKDDCYPTEDFIRKNVECGVKTIAIFRDPRAAWHSTVNRFDAGDCFPVSPLFLETWNRCVDEWWRERANLLTVRYEDMVSRPDEMIELLWRFLGVSNENCPPYLSPISGKGDARGRQGNTIDTLSVHKWHGMPPQARDQITAVCGEGMQELGYLNSA